MSAYKLILKSNSDTLNIEDLHLSDENKRKITQLIEEFTYLDALEKYNLTTDNKILLHGTTGCGKTATANAIAKRLNKKIVSLHLGEFVSSRLGETSKNITSVFTAARLENAVLFIDEFDFIGKARDYDQKDSGEIKRLVNTLLQLIDNLDKHTLLICATNHIEVIDTAILRRFQLKLAYHLPTKQQLNNYYKHLFSSFSEELIDFDKKYEISYAEAKDYVFQKVKKNIITNEKKKKQLLFSYGTLQLESVQQATYGRKLNGKDDVLTGYKLENLQIKDPSVIEKSNQEFHPIAIKSHQNNDSINGKIFEITTEELHLTDRYEVADYKRILEKFQSGIQAWVYIKK